MPPKKIEQHQFISRPESGPQSKSKKTPIYDMDEIQEQFFPDATVNEEEATKLNSETITWVREETEEEKAERDLNASRKWLHLRDLKKLASTEKALAQYLTDVDGRKQARQQDADLANYIREVIMEDAGEWDEE